MIGLECVVIGKNDTFDDVLIQKNMKDTDFEKKSRDHAEGMAVVSGFTFLTYSPGFSNVHEIPELSDEQIRTSMNDT